MDQDITLFDGQAVLITGGGGYLGSKLCEKLAKTGALIYLLDIQFNKISEKLMSQYKNINKTYVDITNKETVENICKKIRPDYIFHFCALLNRDRDFSLYQKLYEVNVEGTLNLLEGLKNVDYKGLYYSSSGEVYGNSKSPFNEEQMPKPSSPYSLTKLMAENLIQTFSSIYFKPYTILRIFNFFGPDMPENFFISQLISNLKKNKVFKMTEGEQIRDFLHIDDLINSIIYISLSDQSKGEVINICSGKGEKLIDLAQKISAILNKENRLEIGALPYRLNEIWEMIGENGKLKKYFNEEFKTIFDVL
jgi:nucleoside-diphosphate-sugar epimerase